MKTRGRCFWNDRLHPIGYLIVIVSADWVFHMWRNSAKSDAGQAPPGSSISILICVRERREDFALLGSKLWAKSFISLRTRSALQSKRDKKYIGGSSLKRLLSLTYSEQMRMPKCLFKRVQSYSCWKNEWPYSSAYHETTPPLAEPPSGRRGNNTCR